MVLASVYIPSRLISNQEKKSQYLERGEIRKMNQIQTIVVVLTFVSAFGALGAAIGAWLSARSTRSATEAQLLFQLLREYAKPDMLRALRTLRNWKAEQGDEEKWRKALENADPKAQEVDLARRCVSHYFLDALKLYESDYVIKRFLRVVGSKDGINILYDIVEPLEYALNPAYDKSKFDKLRQICGRAGTSRLIRPIPNTPEPMEPASEEEKKE